jgi:hypothetical protein
MIRVPLRDLPDGARFVLIRTGDRYRITGRETVKGRRVILVRREDGKERVRGSLHHSCHVSPIIKPHVRPKP